MLAVHNPEKGSEKTHLTLSNIKMKRLCLIQGSKWLRKVISQALRAASGGTLIHLTGYGAERSPPRDLLGGNGRPSYTLPHEHTWIKHSMAAEP